MALNTLMDSFFATVRKNVGMKGLNLTDVKAHVETMFIVHVQSLLHFADINSQGTMSCQLV